MPHRARLASILVTGILLIPLTACAADSWETPHASPTAVGTPGTGFAPAVAPAPEATVTPLAGSWEGVSPSPGYRVVLLTAGDDAPTQALVTAVREWSEAEDVDLRQVPADDDLVGGIDAAIALQPDLIISAGEELIDILALASANHGETSFLIVGAEIAEPTYNVTAVDWSGAGFRGSEVGTATDYDPDSFTAQRCAAAVRAGTTAVLTGLTGVVLWID